VGNPYAPPGENARPAPAPPAPDRPAPDRPSPERPTPERPTSERPTNDDSDRWPGALRPVPTPPPARTPRPPVDSAVSKATARRSLHFFMLLLAAVVTSSLPLPWQVGSLVFVLVAIVVGTRALVLAWRSGVRGGVLFALGAGIAMAGMVALAMTTLLAVWPQQMERQRCLATAVTISATQRCEAEFQESISRLAPQRQTSAS
jgi:hypothetical protein